VGSISMDVASPHFKKSQKNKVLRTDSRLNYVLKFGSCVVDTHTVHFDKIGNVRTYTVTWRLFSETIVAVGKQ
jgi:hypothetical protein